MKSQEKGLVAHPSKNETQSEIVFLPFKIASRSRYRGTLVQKNRPTFDIKTKMHFEQYRRDSKRN